MSEDALVYYPNPPIPLERDFEGIIINELNFIEPFAPALFEPLTSEEQAEFDEILKGISGTVTIPECERPHAPPEFNYLSKNHSDGYPVEYETLENDTPGFHIDSVTGHIGNVVHDENLHHLYKDSDSSSDEREINKELQKKAEIETKRRADEMAAREAKARTEEGLRVAEAAKKKAGEAHKLIEEARRREREELERRRKEEEEERKRKEERKKREEERKKREEERKKREEERRQKEQEERKRREEERIQKEQEERKRREEEEKRKKEQEKPPARPPPSQPDPNYLPPVLRNRFKNLNIINPGGAPTTMGHMKRIIQTNKSNEATINRPKAS